MFCLLENVSTRRISDHNKSNHVCYIHFGRLVDSGAEMHVYIFSVCLYWVSSREVAAMKIMLVGRVEAFARSKISLKAIIMKVHKTFNSKEGCK